MMRPEITIEVTAEDIRLGLRHESCACPVARAAARAFGQDIHLHNATTDGQFLDFWTGDGWVNYLLPEEASRFVLDFDRSGPNAVKPFTFTAKLAPEDEL